MRRAIAAWSLTPVLLVAVGGACSRESVDTSQTSETLTPQAVEVPLHEQRESADAEGPNGTPVDATLAGRSYPESTGMWVGCRGVAATATFRLGRNFALLTATAGLQEQAPDGLVVRVTISGDGQVLDEFTVSKTQTSLVDVSVGGLDLLVVAAILDKGACAPGRDPYGRLAMQS